MVPPQLRDTGLKQSSTATGASRPLPLNVPNGDTTTTPNPSVATTLNPSVTTDRSVIEGSPLKSGNEPERMKIIDEAQNEIIAAGKAPNKLKSSNDATRKHQVNFTDSIEYPQGITRLPSDFCSQCLTCHPYKSGNSTYHIRSFRENLAMHEAISLGKLPKVNPWKAFAKAFKPPSPKPEPEQAQEQPGLCSRTLSEAGKRYYESAREGLSGVGQIDLLYDLLEAEFKAEQRMKPAIPAQQAPAAQQFGSYGTPVTPGGYNFHYPLPTEPWPRSPQPTGPPPKKRKTGNANEGSRRAAKGARFGGAHTAVMQGAGGRRITAQTPQPTTNLVSNMDERQRASSDPLDNVSRTGQTESLNITNVPTTGASTKPPAKGAAAAAQGATDEAAQQAVDNVAAAKKAASNNNKPT